MSGKKRKKVVSRPKKVRKPVPAPKARKKALRGRKSTLAQRMAQSAELRMLRLQIAYDRAERERERVAAAAMRQAVEALQAQVHDLGERAAMQESPERALPPLLETVVERHQRIRERNREFATHIKTDIGFSSVYEMVDAERDKHGVTPKEDVVRTLVAQTGLERREIYTIWVSP